MTRDESRRVKAWLWQYRDAIRDCRRLEDEYRQLLESQEAPEAIRYDGMPGGQGGNSDLSSLMVLREELRARIAQARSLAASAMAERLRAIESLPSFAQREVMSMRYIQLVDCRPMGWIEIARRSGYSEQYIYDIHGQALANLNRMAKDLSKSELIRVNQSFSEF